jgi:hypothetical protein
MSGTPAVTLATVRATLATAIEGAGYRAHRFPPPTVMPPAVVIVPDEPYLTPEVISSGGNRWAVAFELIVAVAPLDNEGQLIQLEDIVVDVCRALPRGLELGPIQRPTLEQVGPTELLTARIPVVVRANLSPAVPPPPPPPAPPEE